ncbi:MAG: PKD domain-containing protein [Cuniculiplasma sp.]
MKKIVHFKRINKKKLAISIFFVSIMLVSGVGISTFQALSQWMPSGASAPVTPYSGTGSGTKECASDLGYAYLRDSAGTFDVGQTVFWNGTVCEPDPGDTAQGHLWYLPSATVTTCYEILSSTAILGVTDKVVKVSWSASRTFSSPGSKAWYVTLTGSSTDTSGKATITVNPALSVSGITPSKTSIDVGQSITISPSVSGGTSPYSYSWSESGAPGSFSSTTSSTPTWTSSGKGTASFSVSVKDAAGETAGATASVTVKSDPTITASSSPSPSDAGQTVDFSTAASGGTGTYPSYSYILYDGTSTSDSQLTSGTTSTFQYTFSSLGSYLLDYSVTDSNGYTSSTSYTQVVHSDPSVSISSSQDPTDAENSIEFKSSVSGGTPGYSYSWSADGNSYTTQDINVSFSSSGTYNVELTVTDAAGYSVSTSYFQTVNSNPTVTASSNVSSADVGYPIEFSSSPSGGTGSYSYSWTLNGNEISTAQHFSYFFSSSGLYTLTVTITDSVGKTSSATVSVTIHPNPSISSSSSQNPTDVGNSVTFSSSVSGGTGTDTYVWTINGVQQSTASQFSYSFSTAGIYFINITVTDSDGHISSYSIEEKVNPDPSVTVHVNRNPADVEIPVYFVSIISGGTGPYTYLWSLNGNSYTTQDVNYTFMSSGTFSVELTVTDASGNHASYSVDEVVNPVPTVNIQASYQRVDLGIKDTFSASVTGGTSPFNYTWTLGAKILNYSQQFHTNFTQAGRYTINLTVTDYFGEKATGSYTVQVVPKPSALIEGPNRTDVSTSTYWEGYGSYGTAPYNYYWYLNGINTSAGLYLQYSFPKTGTYNISLVIEDSQGDKAYAYLIASVRYLPKISLTETRHSTDVGVPIYFNSSISGGTPFFNYTWSIAGIGFVGYQNNLEYSFSNPGKYNVSLQIYDGSGNSASSSIAITINAIPKVSINAQYSNIDPNVTDGFNSVVSGGTPVYTFAWYVNGTLSSSSSSMNHSFNAPGIYPIMLVVSDSRGESTSYVMDITVVRYPSVSILASRTSIDANVSDIFRAFGSGGIGPYSYEWIIAGHTLTGSTASYSFHSPGNYSVQLVVSDSFGKDASSSVVISVFKDPSVAVSWTGKPTVSEEFPLHASVTGGIGPYSISWVFPSGQHETGPTINHVFSSSGPDVFEVQVGDQGGFTGTRNFTIDVGLFVSIAANRTSGLGPLTVQFSASVLGGSGYAFNWTFSPGHISLEQNPSYTFQPGNYTVKFQVKSSNGATGSKTITIKSLPPPVSFVYSTNLNITQAFHFKAAPNWDASRPYSMSWSFPNGQTLTGMDVSYKFPVYNEFSTVIATFTYGNGKIWTQYLTVRMVPSLPQITFSPPSIIPVDTMLSLNATATSADSNSFTYLWIINGLSYSGQSQLYYFSTAGNYSIKVTSTDSLGASVSITKSIEVVEQGTNSSIAINYNKKTEGAMVYYTIKVDSRNGIQAFEVFFGSTLLSSSEINSTYTHSGEIAYFNVTLDQRDYPAGTYGLSAVAFNNQSSNNRISIPFSVSSQFSSAPPFTLATVINFFGGLTNFLVIMLTVASVIIAYVSLRREENPNVIIQEGGGKGKKSKSIRLKGKKVKK